MRRWLSIMIVGLPVAGCGGDRVPPAGGGEVAAGAEAPDEPPDSGGDGGVDPEPAEDPAAADDPAPADEPPLEDEATDDPDPDPAPAQEPDEDPDEAPDQDDPVEDPDPVEPPPGLCDLSDRTIGREQIEFQVGASVLYVANREGTVVESVDTAGQADGDGRSWDFSEPVDDDHPSPDELLDPADQWWADRYPDATFSTWFDRAGDLHAVYRVTPDTLELLAVVSRSPARNDLTMDPPATVLRFPMEVGDEWEQTVEGVGVFEFTPMRNVTTHRFRVDAFGQVRTPAGRFPVLRLRLDLDQRIPFTGFRRTQRIFTLMAPCYGVVARVASEDDEEAEEFTRAVEYRRLTL